MLSLRILSLWIDHTHAEKQLRELRTAPIHHTRPVLQTFLDVGIGTVNPPTKNMQN